MTLGDILFVVVPLLEVATIFGLVLLERRAPAATLAWVLAVALLPGVGMLLYLALRVRRAKRTSQHWESVHQRMEEVLSGYQARRGADFLDGCDQRTRSMLRLGNALASTPASTANRCRMLVNAAATYRAMIQAMDAATDHIHVEFYIIQPDDTGKRMRDRLAALARNGIEVRVVVDAVGSMKLPSDFWAPLVQAGGQAASFSPVNPLYRLRRRDRIDFRNHRKIVIVDGRLGFTGGINVGREYLGMNPELGHWRDTHIELEGPAVLGLQQAFAEDWLAAAGESLHHQRYFPAPPAEHAGESIVQIVDSGPDRARSPIGHIYFQAIALAERRVWVTSPYFVPDATLEEALVTAALRGVDVRLLLPSKSDSYLVGLAGRSFYPNLLEAGVRIFEYARGFVHAKTLVVDDWVGTVGSANMDIRSFHLNYELNAFVFGAPVTSELARQFLFDLSHADEIDLEVVRQLGYFPRLARASARLLSPLL